MRYDVTMAKRCLRPVAVLRPALLLLTLAVAALGGAVTACDAVDLGGASQASHSSGLDNISVGDLPAEAKTTIGLIETNGPFPYSRDGTVFHNYEGLLPEMPDGYYREYTVATPGATDRGARRIVAGRGGERYYTDDHYSSFRLVVE
jgi:ribonuclease T1